MLPETRYVRLIFPSVCLMFILLFGCKSAHAQLQAMKITETLSASQILANVRKAVGYDNIKKLKRGFAIEEIRDSADSSNITLRMFGRTGEVRQQSKPQDTNTFVFDGQELWMINRLAASSRNGSH